MGIMDTFKKRIHRVFFVLVQVIVGTGDFFEKNPKIGKEYKTRALPNSVSYCR